MKNAHSARIGALLAGAALSALFAGPASAQIETVTVTAEKQASDLEKTPVAVAVYSGEQLEASGINSTQDLVTHTPSLVMSSNTVQGEAYIRGVGTDVVSIAADPSVAFMLDGVYLSRVSSAMQDLYDVQRVEIVKGPQGTLYGRNATGGVVNIVSEQPTDEFTYKADAVYGEYNEQRYRVSVSGPLADNINGRLSLSHHQHDGYVDNLTTGSAINSLNNWTARGILDFQLSDNFKLTVSADGSFAGGSPQTAVRVLSADSPAVVFFGGVVPADPYQTTENSPEKIDNDQGGVSAKAVWNLSGSTLTSLSAYRGSRFHILFDSDGTNIDWINLEARQNSTTFSQEFQLASNPGGDLDWIAGLYYFHEGANSNYIVLAPILGITINPQATNKSNAYAAYAQGTYHINPVLQITAGARYNYEHKDATLDQYMSGVLAGSFVGGKGWSAFTPKFGIQYLPDDNTMLYASATRGFKSGGFNSTALQVPQGFNPEFVWSYEAGLKTTFFDRRLRLNTAAFYYDYKDLQVNVFNSSSITTLENAAKATIRGLEVDLDAMPVDGLTLGASTSFLSAKYGDYISVNPDNPLVGPINLAGNTLVRSPKFSGNFSAEYTTPFMDAGALTGRVEYFWRGRMYFSPYNLAGVSQAGYGLVNARLTYDSETGPWSISLFGNNLGNQLYYQEKARTVGLVGTIGWVGDPRVVGISLAIRN